MQDFDYYDVFAHHGYHAQALKRQERGQAYLDQNLPWFEGMPTETAIVLKGFGHQFGLGDTRTHSRAWPAPTREAPGKHPQRYKPVFSGTVFL